MQSAFAILSSVAYRAIQYFSTLSHKLHDFGGKKFLDIKCVLMFYTTSEGKRLLGRPRRRWEGNIRMDLQVLGCKGMDWIGLAQDRDR
jgi:hypothetical protein